MATNATPKSASAHPKGPKADEVDRTVQADRDNVVRKKVDARAFAERLLVTDKIILDELAK